LADTILIDMKPNLIHCLGSMRPARTFTNSNGVLVLKKGSRQCG